MARVVEDDQIVLKPWQAWLRVVLVGAVVGILFWILMSLLAKFVVEPIACRQIVNVAACVAPTTIAGNIALVLSGLAALFVLIRWRVVQPLVVGIAPVVLLWGLGSWLAGLFWLEAIAWSILLFALAYGLFAWISRMNWLVWTIIISLVIVAAVRIVILL